MRLTLLRPHLDGIQATSKLVGSSNKVGDLVRIVFMTSSLMMVMN